MKRWKKILTLLIELGFISLVFWSYYSRTEVLLIIGTAGVGITNYYRGSREAPHRTINLRADKITIDKELETYETN